MKKIFWPYLIIICSIAANLTLYPNIHGFKIWILPIVMIISHVIYYFLVKNTSLNKVEKENKLDLKVISNSMLMVLFIIHLAIVMMELGYSITFEFVVGIVIGIFIMILANFMQKVEQNYVYGIRTPWTLKSKEVWQLTNRFSSKVFFVTGLMIILFSFLTPKYIILIMIALVSLGALISVFSSYLFFKKVNNEISK